MRELVTDKLWIGNAHDIRPLDPSQFQPGMAVVDLAINEPAASPPHEVFYLRFPLDDSGENEAQTVQLAVNMIVELLQAEVPTLVCCSAGMSRAPALACGALAVRRGAEPDDLLKDLLKGMPHDISPGLWSQVRAAVLSLSQRP